MHGIGKRRYITTAGFFQTGRGDNARLNGVRLTSGSALV